MVQIKVHLYQSIALKILYNFVFGSKMIRRCVCPEIHVKVTLPVRAPSFVSFTVVGILRPNTRSH